MLAPLDFTFSVEGVAVSWEPPSASALPTKAKPQPEQGAALHGEKTPVGPSSEQVLVTGLWLLSEAQMN